MNNMPSKFCLLLEDDPEDQEVFIDALHSISSTTGCYAVSNGEEALIALNHHGFRPDYIFTDLNMPGMDGFQFVNEIKRIDRWKSIPVIVYSSHFSDREISALRDAGVLALYRKTTQAALAGILKRYFGATRKESIL